MHNALVPLSHHEMEESENEPEVTCNLNRVKSLKINHC